MAPVESPDTLQTPWLDTWNPRAGSSAWSGRAYTGNPSSLLSPASAPVLPFPSDAHTPTSTPFDSHVRPRSLRFSTPRVRRGGADLDDDVEALCADLDRRIKALQLSRQQDAADPSAPWAAGADQFAPFGAEQYMPSSADQFMPSGNEQFMSGVPQRVPHVAPHSGTLGGYQYPSALDHVPTNDWSSARRQIHHSAVNPPYIPPQQHTQHTWPGNTPGTPSPSFNSQSHQQNAQEHPGPLSTPGNFNGLGTPLTHQHLHPLPFQQPTSSAPFPQNFNGQIGATTVSSLYNISPLYLNPTGTPMAHTGTPTPSQGHTHHPPPYAPSDSPFPSPRTPYPSHTYAPSVISASVPPPAAYGTPPLGATWKEGRVEASHPSPSLSSSISYHFPPSILPRDPSSPYNIQPPWYAAAAPPLFPRYPSSAPPHLGASVVYPGQGGGEWGPLIPLNPGGGQGQQQGVDLVPSRLLPSPSQVHVRGKVKAREQEEGSVMRVMENEEVLEVMRNLGVLPWLDKCRDVVRQWFAEHLLSSLVTKIDRAPKEVSEALAAVGYFFEVEPLGSSGSKGQSGGTPEEAEEEEEEASSSSLSSSGSESWLRVNERMVTVQGNAMPEDETLQHLIWSLHVLTHRLQQQKQECLQQQQLQPQGMVFHLPQQQQQQQQQQREQQQKQLLELSKCEAAVHRAIEAVQEFRQLKSVLRGSWGNGLMPHDSIPLGYSVRRIQDLVVGSCVRAFQWDSGGDYGIIQSTRAAAVAIPQSPSAAGGAPPVLTVRSVLFHQPFTWSTPASPLGSYSSSTLKQQSSYSPAYSSSNFSKGSSGSAQWSAPLPTDSHLLAYLFCVHLAHPGWCFNKHLHQGASSLFSAASSPLFVGGSLPQHQALSGKMLGVVQGSKGVLSSDADVLIITRQTPPVFAVVWDHSVQFCSQGRTAVWDTVIVLMERLRQHHLSLLGARIGTTPLVADKETSPLLQLCDSLDSARKSPRVASSR